MESKPAAAPWPFPSIDAATVERLDIPGPRYTSYPTVPTWSDAFGPGDYAQALDRASTKAEEPLSLYFHIPFCREHCTYCGCNVVVAPPEKSVDRYVAGLEREIDLVATRLGSRRKIARLHWGGGTPTYLSGPQLERLHAAIRARFELLPDAEQAVEIDPVVTRPSQLDTLGELGFRRLSMGVQDFDPDVQDAVDRHQSVEDTRAVLEHARRIGFVSVNFDLIYGLPRQREESWQRSLAEVIALRPDRVAAYSFAFVPQARPHQRKIEPEDVPQGMEKLALRRLTHEIFTAHGYWPIGMDHFALPQDELATAQSRGRLWRDFQGYTVRRGSDTVALGITGIGDVGGAFVQTDRSLGRYLEAVEAGRFATVRGRVLSDDDRRRQAIITDLMCNFVVDLGDGAGRELGAELADLARLESEGLVRLDGSIVELTPLGRIFVRNVAMVFDADLRAAADPSRLVFSRTL